MENLTKCMAQDVYRFIVDIQQPVQTKRLVTSRRQYLKLVELLEANPSVVKEKQKGSQTFWNEVANALNELGPPQKDGTGWKKVWTDFKCGLKKKIAHNNRDRRATGGGPSKAKQLNEIEMSVLDLIELDDTAGALDICAFGTPTTSQQQSINPESLELATVSNDIESIAPNTLHMEDTTNSHDIPSSSAAVATLPSPEPTNIEPISDPIQTIRDTEQQHDDPSTTPCSTRKRSKVRAERQLEAMQKHNAILQKRLKFEEERFNFDKNMREAQAERENQQIELNRQQIEINRQQLEINRQQLELHRQLKDTCRSQ